MNIVWIEDFGGVTEPAQFADTLFQSLKITAETESLSNWMESRKAATGDTRDIKSLLPIYSEQALRGCRITLLTNVNEYSNRFAKQRALFDADLFILDIKLDKDHYPPAPPLSVPPGFEDRNDFHEWAGFFIYNDLIARRIPKDRICFLTGEEPKLVEFKTACAQLLMAPPRSFQKIVAGADIEIPEFSEWLQEHAVNADYYRFRHCALEAIEWAIDLVSPETSEHKLHFRKYIGEGNHNYFSRTDALGYLGELKEFLLVDVEPLDRPHRLRVFLRALAHDWEGRTNNAPFDRKQQPVLYALGVTMRRVRNTLSHGHLLDCATVQDISAILLINFRAMFGDDPLKESARPYERALLELLGDLPEVDGKEQRAKLNEQYDVVRSELRGLVYSEAPPSSGKKIEDRDFYDQALDQLTRAQKLPNLNYAKLVAGTFWQAQAKIDISRKTVDLRTKDWPQWVRDFHRLAFPYFYS